MRNFPNVKETDGNQSIEETDRAHDENQKIVQLSTQTHSSSIERPVCSSSNTGPQRQTSVLADMEVWRPGVSDSSSRRGLGWVRRVGIAVASARLVSPPNVAIPGREICCAGFMKRSLPPSTPYPTRRVCTPCRRLWISLGQIQNLPWPDLSTASLAPSPFPLAPHGCFLTATLDALVERV